MTHPVLAMRKFSDLLDIDPGLHAGKRVNEQIIKLLINRPYHPAEAS